MSKGVGYDLLRLNELKKEDPETYNRITNFWFSDLPEWVEKRRKYCEQRDVESKQEEIFMEEHNYIMVYEGVYYTKEDLLNGKGPLNYSLVTNGVLTEEELEIRNSNKQRFIAGW